MEHAAAAGGAETRADRDGRTSLLTLLLFGLLPLAGLVAELGTGIFSFAIYPVFPTGWHLAGVAAAVAINLALHVHAHVGSPARWLILRAVGYGFVTGVTAIYVLGMLPASPLILFTCFIGLGFLAAAPFWTAGGLIPLGRRLVRGWRTAGRRQSSLLALVVPALLLFPWLTFGPEWSRWRVRRDYALATCDDPIDAAAARARLRQLPLAPQLAWCRDGDTSLDDARFAASAGLHWYLSLLESRESLSAVSCREAFYLAHGRAYTAFPEQMPAPHWLSRPHDEAPRDPGTEGETRHGLRCRGSRIEVDVEPAAALARIEWTWELENLWGIAQEARLGLAMHPDAVASALSLWIGGIERPAAFAAEETVTKAYDEITRRQRDPALLRETAPGRLRLLVFPVPARDRARVRIAITTPLDLHGDAGELALPVLCDRNFALSSAMEQELVLRNGALVKPHRPLTDRIAELRWTFPITATTTWTEDAEGPLVQRLVPRARAALPESLLLVVDDSVTAAAADTALLDAWPADQPCTLLLATADGYRKHVGTCGDLELRAALDALRHEGGVDASHALRHACELAHETPGAAVVWLHGAQPLAFGLLEGLFDDADRVRSALVLVPLSPEENVIADALLARRVAVALPHTGSPRADLARLAARGLPGSSVEPFASHVREFSRPPEPPAGAIEVSDQLARYRAALRARELAAAGDPGAAGLAARYRLVTAGAGAVVLENSAQYREFGLDPGALLGTEPMAPIGDPVPEPATWLLFATGIGVLLLLRLRTRRALVPPQGLEPWTR